YHVAPSTDQDNHCANWGASYGNRTAVLIPTGTALSTTSFLDAVKARRVFATHDKNAQLILTANGHLMGERFANSGTLAATATYANGVTKVEFYVDGALAGTDTSSPYSMTLDSTTLTNASHTLLVKAYDPSSNIGQSSVAFSINNGTVDNTPPTCSAS